MTSMESAQLEALKREFQESRDRVWRDPSIPLGQKQAQVERLWAEFDARRNELRETMAQGQVPAGASRRPVLFAGKRRRPPWK